MESNPIGAMSMTSNFDPDQLKLAKGHFIDNTWLNEGTGLEVRRASDLRVAGVLWVVMGLRSTSD